MASVGFVPMLMVTTESQQAKRMEAKTAGATGWLVKPVHPDALFQVKAGCARRMTVIQPRLWKADSVIRYSVGSAAVLLASVIALGLLGQGMGCPSGFFPLVGSAAAGLMVGGRLATASPGTSDRGFDGGLKVQLFILQKTHQ
jgi:CheY-like chemotaxis protein